MKEFLSMLLMPIPLLYILIIGALTFYFFNRRKTARFLFICACCWGLLISTNTVPKYLVEKLESKYHQLSDSEIFQLPDTFNIIILGAGHTDDNRLSPNNQLSTIALGRLVEGIRIRHAVCRVRHSACGIKIIMSGYGGKSELPQAVVFYRTGLDMGLDSTDMAISPEPENTKAEAKEYLERFGNDKKLVIVTSAIHMPRAIRLFSDKGVYAVPAPANFIIKHGSVKNPWRWIPKAENISIMELAMHEYVGMLWYKLGGR